MYKLLAVYFAVFIITFLGVGIFRRWSLKREFFDIPNERSSHTEPTPKGGGVIIFIVSLLTFSLYLVNSGENLHWAFFAGAVIVGLISLFDDIKTISPLFRIVFHSLAAGLVVFEIGGFESIFIPFYGIIETGVWGYIGAFVWIIWFINAYNFMDGIDGIAALQAVTAGIGWCLTGFLWGFEDIGFLGGVLAVTAFGFLLHNWQPAKIFMGDVGSAFLGYSFAVLPLLCMKRAETAGNAGILPLIAVLMIWFFIFDSVLTFLKRLFRRKKVWQAHREHIYQKLVISGLSHATVTILYGFISLILVIFLIIFLKYSLSFEKAVLPVMLIETVLLLLFQLRKVNLKN